MLHSAMIPGAHPGCASGNDRSRLSTPNPRSREPYRTGYPVASCVDQPALKELLSFRSAFLHAEPQPSCEFSVKISNKVPSQLDLTLQPSRTHPQNPEANLNLT